MKNIFKLAGVAAVALALTQSLQAVPITGGINFNGSAQLNSSSVNTATAETAWVAPTLTASGSASGAFAGIAPLSTVTMSSAVWNFNTSTPINSFWSVGGFTFKLLSSAIITQTGGVLGVLATGTVSAAGYDDTAMQWRFTIQDPSNGNPPSFSWSASTQSVPDGGATVMLMGIALSGVALLRKKLMA